MVQNGDRWGGVRKVEQWSGSVASPPCDIHEAINSDEEVFYLSFYHSFCFPK